MLWEITLHQLSRPSELQYQAVYCTLCWCVVSNRQSVNHGPTQLCFPVGPTVSSYIFRSFLTIMKLIFLIVWLLLPTNFRCIGLLLTLISLNDIHMHSVGRLWMRDRPVAETSTCTIHNIHKRHRSMPPAKFVPTIPASGRRQIFASDCATAGICRLV